MLLLAALDRDRGSETLASLSSPILNHVLSGSGRHASPEAVCSQPLYVAGLISSFHLAPKRSAY